MDRGLIVSKIVKIVEKYLPSCEINNDTPLTSEPYYFNARSLTAIFIDIEGEFNLDLNKVFEHRIDYSINSITDAIQKHV